MRKIIVLLVLSLSVSLVFAELASAKRFFRIKTSPSKVVRFFSKPKPKTQNSTPSVQSKPNATKTTKPQNTYLYTSSSTKKEEEDKKKVDSKIIGSKKNVILGTPFKKSITFHKPHKHYSKKEKYTLFKKKSSSLSALEKIAIFAILFDAGEDVFEIFTENNDILPPAGYSDIYANQFFNILRNETNGNIDFNASVGELMSLYESSDVVFGLVMQTMLSFENRSPEMSEAFNNFSQALKADKKNNFTYPNYQTSPDYAKLVTTELRAKMREQIDSEKYTDYSFDQLSEMKKNNIELFNQTMTNWHECSFSKSADPALQSAWFRFAIDAVDMM